MSNSLKKTAKERIELAFIKLIQAKDINEISVTSLVKLAKVNRSTFYVNYTDIYDLANKIKKNMYFNVLSLYKEERNSNIHSYDFLKLFEHIKDNQMYYKTMFKLNFNFLDYCSNYLSIDDAIRYLGTSDNLEYHLEFFKAGMKAIIKKWLDNDCQESPLEMANIIKLEYERKNIFIK